MNEFWEGKKNFKKGDGRLQISFNKAITELSELRIRPLDTVRAFVKADIAENREGFVKVTFSLSYKFLPMIYEFFITRYYGSITAVNKIFLQNYLFFG